MNDTDRTWRDYADFDEQESRSTYTYSKCPRCGGKYVYHSFMVADGEDDVDWDSEEYCTECDGLIDTNTEFGFVKPERNVKSSTIK